MFIANLKAIWREILELRDGQPTILRATDLYVPIIDLWKKNNVFDDCTACWLKLSDAPRQAAQAYNIPFLSRYDAFDGPNHDEDPKMKGLIRKDGIHPSDMAGQFTAELLGRMGYEPVGSP